MKFTIAYYLLLVYLSVLFRPAMPLVSDALGHTLSESVHLSTIHMVYGTQHLQKEIAAKNADSKQNGSHSTQKVVELVSVHLLQSSEDISFTRSTSTQSFSLFVVHKLPLWSTLLHLPPPDIFG